MMFIFLYLEHCKNLLSDSWRLNQLDKSSVDPSHPYSKFGSGKMCLISCDAILHVTEDVFVLIYIIMNYDL